MSFFTASIQRGGVWYALSDRNPYRWLSDAGLGAAPLHPLVERGPAQHGETRLGYRLDPRRITAAIGFHAASEFDYWARRRELVDTIFAPTLDAAPLRFVVGDATRQIDTYLAGELQLGSQERSHLWHRAGVALHCPDPTFYDPELQVIVINSSLISNGWAIPWDLPWEISGSTIDQEVAVAYPGAWNARPLIRLFGPASGPIISNRFTRTDTGEVETYALNFAGHVVAAGDYIEIDLRYGSKTVTAADGTNRLGDLTADSDLASWQLMRPLEAVGGINTIRLQGSGISTATTLQVQYYNRYLGI